VSPFLQSLLTAAITAPLAAWLTARFALHRFYRERVWERKAAAYTAIFEALHDMRQWFDEHMTAGMRGYDIPEAEQSRLGESYREAKARLELRLDAERWLLPQACFDRLKDMTRDLEKHRESWFENLDEGLYATRTAMEDMRPIAQRDLGLTTPTWQTWCRRRLEAGTARAKGLLGKPPAP
jgi:hypothetical protein